MMKNKWEVKDEEPKVNIVIFLQQIVSVVVEQAATFTHNQRYPQYVLAFNYLCYFWWVQH